MRKAGDFNVDKNIDLDSFINEHVYKKLDDGIHPVIIYENLVLIEEVNHKALEVRLKELDFKVTKKEIGVDNVIEIRIK